MLNDTAPVRPLLVSTRDAATILAICERTLYSLTVPRGPLPSVRIGRAVRYRISDLEAFAAAEAAKGQPAGEPA